MAPDKHIVQGAHVFKKANVLKSSRDTCLGDFMNRLWPVALSVKAKLSAVWRIKTGDQVKQGCFPRAVRTDQAMYRSDLDAQVDVSKGLKPAKALRHLVDFKQAHVRRAKPGCASPPGHNP